MLKGDRPRSTMSTLVTVTEEVREETVIKVKLLIRAASNFIT